MSRIIRTETSDLYAKAVEYHGFVYLAGITADDMSDDVSGQTRQVLATIDRLLEEHGTDKTRLLQAQIWLKHMTDRPAMNTLWVEWLRDGGLPARACIEANMADPACLVEIMITACK